MGEDVPIKFTIIVVPPRRISPSAVPFSSRVRLSVLIANIYAFSTMIGVFYGPYRDGKRTGRRAPIKVQVVMAAAAAEKEEGEG